MKIRTKLFLGFEIILTLLVIAILISYANSNKLIDDTNWIIHTEEVLVELKGIVTHLIDAETGQRGYIITGKERYLEPYDNSLIEIDHSIDYLKELTEDNPTQQEYIKLLEPLINDKFGELKETIGLRRYVGFNASREVVLNDQGKDIMDRIRQLVGEMEDEEERLLMLRSQAPEESKQRTNVLLIALLIFGIAIGGGIAGYISISISNPLKKLISVTQELGKGNLDIRIGIKTKDEIGELAAVFNKMAQDLKLSQKQLSIRAQNLEKEVSERTVELKKEKEAAEDFANLAVGRELKMVELKKRIGELEEKLKKGETKK